MASHRIVTLTLNPSLDLACEAEAVRPIRKIRTRGESFTPGGGGVNVSRIVHELGGETLALLTSGGATGTFLEDLLGQEGVPHRGIPVAGRTRVSHVVLERTSGLEYRFVPEGPEIAAPECEAALAVLAAEAGEWVVLSGSLPRGSAPGLYAAAASQARSRGQRIALDTSGEALKLTLEQGGVDLAKPSLGEFEALVGRELRDAGSLEAAAREVAMSGRLRLLAVSLGQRGALLATSEGKCWRLPAPDVPVRSASGAGDAFLGAMVLALTRGATPEEAFAWGSAAGGATVAASGTAHARRADVEALHEAMRRELSAA